MLRIEVELDDLLFPHKIDISLFRQIENEDYQSYLKLMSEWCLKYQVEIWAYCLMPNHVHLIAVPAVPLEKPTDVIQGRLVPLPI